MLETFFLVIFPPCLKRYPYLYSTLMYSVDLFPDSSLSNRLCLGFLELDLRNVLMQGKLLAGNLNCLLKMGDQSTGMEPREHLGFEDNLASTFANVKDVIGKLCSYKDGSGSQEEEVNITTWDGLFTKAQNDLNLDNLCKLLSETFGSIVSWIVF